MSEQIQKADIVICGAGIAGISAAYFLAMQHGLCNILLVDERPPLTLTSDKSSEAYRNWWPGPGSEMVRFMNRSIDLLEGLADESDNYFHLNRRGYLFLTSDEHQASVMAADAQEISCLGAGALRVFDGSTAGEYQPATEHGYHAQSDGADWAHDPAFIQAHFPFISPAAVAMLHTRRCGWLSAQQLGMYMLQKVKACGVRLVNGRISAIETRKNCVTAVKLSDGQRIPTNTFINAAGPLVGQVSQLMGIDLPVYNELHGKVAFEDPLGIVPRDAPMIIWNDPIELPWSDEERQELAEFEETAWLLEPFPAGLHFRPEGGPGSQTLLALWPYHIEELVRPVWPIKFDEEYVEILLRGLTWMVPGLAVYLDRLVKPYVDGGYYCKTRENRPLICPLPVDGAFVIGALSGYGIMAAPAAGELLAAHIIGRDLPDYAPAFHLDRYQDAAYQALLADWSSLAGQL